MLDLAHMCSICRCYRRYTPTRSPHLPQLKANVLEVLQEVQLGVILEVRVVNVGCHPDALVLGVVNPTAQHQSESCCGLHTHFVPYL